MELYATRIPVLDRREMMWEWDLPRGVELSSREATSKEYCEKTVRELDQIKDRPHSVWILDMILPWR